MDLRIEQNLARQVRTQAATLRRVRAERDAALAEVERLRAGLKGLRVPIGYGGAMDSGLRPWLLSAEAHNAYIAALLEGDPQ